MSSKRTADLVSREVVFVPDDEDYADVRVERYRDSNGLSQIRLIAGDHCLVISNSTFGDRYEMVARELADVLDDAVNEPCKVPGDFTK